MALWHKLALGMPVLMEAKHILLLDLILPRPYLQINLHKIFRISHKPIMLCKMHKNKLIYWHKIKHNKLLLLRLQNNRLLLPNNLLLIYHNRVLQSSVIWLPMVLTLQHQMAHSIVQHPLTQPLGKQAVGLLQPMMEKHIIHWDKIL